MVAACRPLCTTKMAKVQLSIYLLHHLFGITDKEDRVRLYHNSQQYGLTKNRKVYYYRWIMT